MNRIFTRTRLAHCEGDWCTRTLISQFLVNRRKYLKKAEASAHRISDNLGTEEDIEAQYQRERVHDPSGDNEPDMDDVGMSDMGEVLDSPASGQDGEDISEDNE
jgi:hypothetical protein